MLRELIRVEGALVALGTRTLAEADNHVRWHAIRLGLRLVPVEVADRIIASMQDRLIRATYAALGRVISGKLALDPRTPTQEEVWRQFKESLLVKSPYPAPPAAFMVR